MILRSTAPFRLIAITFVLLLLSSQAAMATESTPVPVDPLPGLLGGTFAGFIDVYGDPIDNPYNEYGIVYFAVSGYGQVYAMFKPDPATYDPMAVRSGTAPNEIATIIVLQSPRDDLTPGTSPDPADFPITDAEQRARAFLPTDTVIGPASTDGDVRFMTCSSTILGEVLGVPEASVCRIALLMSGPDSVSYITIAVSPGIPAGAESVANPCAGLTDWANTTGDRMAAAQEQLARLAGLNGSDPATPAALVEIESTLQELAQEQGELAPPAVASTANRLLIDAFSLYADAAAYAGEALTTGDEATIDKAVSAIDRATRWVAQVNKLIERGATGCGIEVKAPSVATPAA